MKKLVTSFMCIVMFTTVFAQNRRITGSVTDENGKNVEAASVRVKGSTIGTTTNAQGQFALNVPANEITLQISSTGYSPVEQSVPAATNEVRVLLAQSSQQLQEVVVSALGVMRERRALSSSQTQIKVEDLTQARPTNFANGLAGKVAGLSVTSTATGPAGSSRVVIRGNTSLNGSNQPLYVIDGIPIDNSNRGSAGEWGGTDGGDGIQSINPDEIETVTVLKGGQAAALYGSRASNGVILITTKKGSSRRGVGIEVNSNFQLDQPVNYTDWQYQYGLGVLGQKPATADDAAGINLNSWGAAIDNSNTVTFSGDSMPYSAHRDNFKDFYKTGSTFTNTISLNGGSDKATYYFTVSDMNNKSVVPNSSLRRNNISLNTVMKPIDHLSVTANIRYIRDRVRNRPRVSDSPGNANFSVFMLPTTMDVRSLKDHETTPDGSEMKWQGNDFVTNPYWATEMFQEHDERDRFIGSLEARYDISKWLYVRGRMGSDMYTLSNFAITPVGTRYVAGGELNDQSKLTFSEFNGEAMLGSNAKFGNIGLDAFVGANMMHRREEKDGFNGNGFFGPDFYTVSNLANVVPYYNFSQSRINSVYGQAELNYNKYLYLTVTGRNDWFSALAPSQWSIFYPSIGASFVLSDAVKLPAWIGMARIYSSWAQVGGGADPYQLSLTYKYNNPPYGTMPAASIAQTQIPNANLKPYTLTTSEIGFEARFLDNRLGTEVAVYQRRTTDDIVSSTLSQSTGFGSIILNVGSVRNRGVEVLLNGTPMRNDKFTWDASLNFAYNRSMIESLYQDLNSIRVASARSFTSFVDHIIGKPYGQVMGFEYKRDSATGALLLNAGLPQRGDLVAFGTGVAPYTVGLTNTFSFAGINLSFLIDGRFGGTMYSGTNDFATYRGLQKNTLVGREKGIIADGIDEATGEKNTTMVDAQTYYQTIGLNISQDFIYKSDFIKLRQVILGYNLPARLFGNSPIKGITVSLVGRNLAIIKKYVPNVDPESTYNSGNGQGLEWFGAPLTKQYGVNANVRF